MDLQLIDLEDGSHRPAAVWRFFGQFPEANGAEAIHLVLRVRVEPDLDVAILKATATHRPVPGEPSEKLKATYPRVSERRLCRVGNSRCQCATSSL